MAPPPHLQKHAPPPPKPPAPETNWIVPAIIVAVALVLAPVAYLGVRALLSPTGTIDASGGAVDSGARIEIEMMRQQIEDLQKRMQSAEEQISALASRPTGDELAGISSGEEQFDDGNNSIVDSYAQTVLLAGRRINNEGLSVPSPSFQIEMFGMPRESLSDDCEPMTNEKLKAILVTEDVGPIRVSMLKPAVESLRVVFEKIKATDEDLYKRINTAGALCVRRIRGSANSVSSHSFGLAVDLNIDGVLDTLGDGKTQLGLTILADFFQAEGWFWGASFSREDSMHFEVSKEKITQWRPGVGCVLARTAWPALTPPASAAASSAGSGGRYSRRGTAPDSPGARARPPRSRLRA